MKIHRIYIFPDPVDKLMKKVHNMYPDLPDMIGKGKLFKWQSPENKSEAIEKIF
jgi:hypothetical protein